MRCIDCTGREKVPSCSLFDFNVARVKLLIFKSKSYSVDGVELHRISEQEICRICFCDIRKTIFDLIPKWGSAVYGKLSS